MKKGILILATILIFSTVLKSQTTRYFEFITNCGHGNWQDSSFVAATSNQDVIDSLLVDLSKPLVQRRFISGNIDYGNGGHNHNASHWFLWHFIPNQWALTDLAIEVCDGCPYTDVDSDTATWVGNIGQFCPWTARPAREVLDPLGKNELSLEIGISLYPNPAKEYITLDWNSIHSASIIIYNSLGEIVKVFPKLNKDEEIDISTLPNGLYTIRIECAEKVGMKQLVLIKN